MSWRRKVSDRVKRDIGLRIREARMAAGFATSREFAEALQIEPLTYRRYERGEVVPDVELLIAIAALTNFSLDWLIAGQGSVRHPR